jgi:4-nitrophenyl phosphatase/phosphoglycolate phosphatase
MEHNLDPKARTLMVGDRLDTDIMFANNAGVDGCLVFSGVTRGAEDMRKILGKESRVHPKFTIDSFGLIDEAVLNKA